MHSPTVPPKFAEKLFKDKSNEFTYWEDIFECQGYK